MKYCLAIGLHNLFFDIALIDNEHNIIAKYKCNYDRNKDISSNIHDAYKKYFSKYDVINVGVGISNNIEFKDDILYGVKSFNFTRYNLKKSLEKLFKVNIIMLEETYLASLASYHLNSCKSLLYLVIDNKISNSFVVDGEIIELDDDINFRINKFLNDKCNKNSIKSLLLLNGLDDEYVGGYFISKEEKSARIVQNVCFQMNKKLEKIVKEITVEKIIFAGYIGEYLEYFKKYLPIVNRVDCDSVDNHRELTLLGVSHLIFKDN